MYISRIKVIKEQLPTKDSLKIPGRTAMVGRVSPREVGTVLEELELRGAADISTVVAEVG